MEGKKRKAEDIIGSGFLSLISVKNVLMYPRTGSYNLKDTDKSIAQNC